MVGNDLAVGVGLLPFEDRGVGSGRFPGSRLGIGVGFVLGKDLVVGVCLLTFQDRGAGSGRFTGSRLGMGVGFLFGTGVGWCVGVVLGVGARLGVGFSCFMDRRFTDSRLGIGVGLILGIGSGRFTGSRLGMGVGFLLGTAVGWWGGIGLGVGARLGVGFSCCMFRLFLLTSTHPSSCCGARGVLFLGAGVGVLATVGIAGGARLTVVVVGVGCGVVCDGCFNPMDAISLYDLGRMADAETAASV